MSASVEPENRRASESDTGEDGDHDPQYEPIVSLPLVDVPTNEEDEVELVKIRARLYRYDASEHEWKERGTGDIKLLQHKINNSVRVVMRRDKTLKVCANHFITPDIRMNIHCGSDKAFNWSVFADFADEQCKSEMLAIKFGNAANAELWKTKFLEAQEIVRTKCSLYNGECSENDSSDSESEYTESPEPKSEEQIPTEKQTNNEDTDGVTIKLKDMKVASEKSE